MSFTPDDEPTIVPVRSRDGTPSAPGVTGLGSGNTLPLGTRLDEFEIIGLVGEGGFGIVYLARDHVLDRNVAIKEYMPSALAARSGTATVVVRSAQFEELFQTGLRSFINEARLLARFDHPSLVKVFRFWDANGTAYMAMPYYRSITLKALLKRGGRPPDEAWLKDLLRPLLHALELLHDDHCFHRDIAPDNILMLDGVQPLLLDFGAARRVIGDLTHDLTAILKPGYAPIEQYAESASMKQGPWTDIYALAAVVYFAIMGRAPDSSVARVMADPLVPLEAAAAGRYSPAFLRAIDKALSVKPQDRPQSVAELRTMLALDDRRRPGRAPLTAAATVPKPDEAPTVRAPPAVRAAAARPQRLASAVAPMPAGATLTRKTPTVPLIALGVAVLVLIGASTAYFLRAPRTSASPDKVQAKAPQPPTASLPAQPAPPSPSPSPAPRPAFSAQLMLHQVMEGRDRARSIAAVAEPVQARIGLDTVHFSIGASRPGYLYILEVGTADADFRLVFPNTLETNNRLEANAVRGLPGTQWSWRARGPAGSSRFVAIVSDAPRDFSRLATLPDGAFLRFPLDVGARAFRDYNGATPLYAGELRCERAGGDCSPVYGAATFSIEQIDAGTAKSEATSGTPNPPRKATREESAGSRANPSTKIASKPECADILQRASLGEPLSAQDQATLKEDCR
ncbi:MAG TPA: serine/threonine-protein kinase [Burkholderiaceae bacterium]|nr:serine/threonine-protein kinase [Burkholderiaceae bacterium]